MSAGSQWSTTSFVLMLVGAVLVGLTIAAATKPRQPPAGSANYTATCATCSKNHPPPQLPAYYIHGKPLDLWSGAAQSWIVDDPSARRDYLRARAGITGNQEFQLRGRGYEELRKRAVAEERRELLTEQIREREQEVGPEAEPRILHVSGGAFSASRVLRKQR